MNLFRVLASGKRGLNEENMSACLAWLLPPGMDHGFGPAFLKAFLAEIGSHAEAADAQFQGELARLGERIKYRLRSNSEDDLSIDVELEHNAGGHDVLVSVNDDWVIAIENKISAASAQDSTQLLGQYRGLCDEACAGQPEPASPEGHRLMVFLVPPHSLAQAEEDFERSVLAEWNELLLGEMHRQDGKVLVSWRRRNGRPSIENVITRMLGDELDGEIEPLHDQTRHTLLPCAASSAVTSRATPSAARKASAAQTRQPKKESACPDWQRKQMNLSALPQACPACFAISRTRRSTAATFNSPGKTCPTCRTGCRHGAFWRLPPPRRPASPTSVP